MDVSGTNSSTPATASGQAQLQLNQGFDQFLRLLTTQLQNQDPLSPMDTQDFTNQLVQFSSVEQQIKTNSNLENLLMMQTLNMTALGVSFIGKNVEVAGNTFQASGDAATEMSYVIPETAETGTISILDEDDNVVFSQDSELSAGRHNFTWNGLDNNGAPVAAGTYKIKVGAMGANNKALNVTTFVPGHVEGLETADDGSLMLLINGKQFPLTDVRKISLAS